MNPTSWRVVARKADGTFEPRTDWGSFDEAEGELVSMLIDGEKALRLESSNHEFCDAYGKPAGG